MQADDGKKFRDVLRGMGRMFGQEPDKLVLDAYWIALREWSYPEFEAAAARLMLTAKFMPRPADFNEIRKASNDTAAECWARALAHAAGLSTCGGHLQEQPSGDERLDAVVRTIGGYRAMASASPRDLQFMAQRFAENFESVTDAEDTRAALPHLTGGPRLTGPRSAAELLTHRKPS